MKTQRSMHFHVNDPKSRFVSVCPASTTRVVRQRGEGGVSPLPSPRGQGGGRGLLAGASEMQRYVVKKIYERDSSTGMFERAGAGSPHAAGSLPLPVWLSIRRSITVITTTRVIPGSGTGR